VDYIAEIEGTILPSANANLQVQAAPGGSGTANQIVIRQGSVGQLWKIA
jgi:hypothetical protein